MDRPVIVHRAVLGSVERMFAILTEHFAGTWPFWLNPRQVRREEAAAYIIKYAMLVFSLIGVTCPLVLSQVMVVPITDKSYEYGQQVRLMIRKAGIHCDVDVSNNKMQKKVRT